MAQALARVLGVLLFVALFVASTLGLLWLGDGRVTLRPLSSSAADCTSAPGFDADTATATASSSQGHPRDLFPGAGGYWSSATDDPAPWVRFTLACSWSITGYQLKGRFSDENPQWMPGAWTLEGSEDGETWTHVDGIGWAGSDQVVKPWPASATVPVTYTVAPTAAFRHFRFRWLRNMAGNIAPVSLNEVSLTFGSSIPTTPPPTTPPPTTPPPTTPPPTATPSPTPTVTETVTVTPGPVPQSDPCGSTPDKPCLVKPTESPKALTVGFGLALMLLSALLVAAMRRPS